MTSIAGVMCVYNDALFVRECLQGVEPVLDQIVIVEGSWNRGGYDYGGNFRSDDGTIEIIQEFAASYPDKVVLGQSIWDEATSRNLTLALSDHDWVLELASDEFYHLEELQNMKDMLIDSWSDVESVGFPEVALYFNFRNCVRGYPRRRLHNIKGREYISANGTGDIWTSVGKSIVSLNTITMYHVQWVGNRDKVIHTNNIDKEAAKLKRKGFTEDPIKIPGTWAWWLENIYLKFDGSNLAELERKNRGSLHCWGYYQKQYRDMRIDSIDPDTLPASIREAPWFDGEEIGVVDFKEKKRREA
jgi:glycosyltransferase involved in cell wall biosynthesis